MRLSGGVSCPVFASGSHSWGVVTQMWVSRCFLQPTNDIKLSKLGVGVQFLTLSETQHVLPVALYWAVIVLDEQNSLTSGL